MTEVGTLMEKLRSSRATVLDELTHLTDEQMELPIPPGLMAQKTPGGVRTMFYRFITHEMEHLNHLLQVLDGLHLAPSESQRILRDLQASRGKLEGLLVGLSDEDLDRKPSEVEWSPRKVLEHIIHGDEVYLGRIREALQVASP
jgi:hypothetical protein